MFFSISSTRKLKSTKIRSSVGSPIPSISADHTFKISKKKARGYRSIDNGFVNSDLKFFIVMDGTGSIVGWELTETTKHDGLQTANKQTSRNIFLSRLQLKYDRLSFFIE